MYPGRRDVARDTGNDERAPPSARVPPPSAVNGPSEPSPGRATAERYGPKHARARRAANLDPRATSASPPYPAGTRVRGTAGLLRNCDGAVTRASWDILPRGQMVVRFDDPVVDRYQLIAVLPEEVRPLYKGRSRRSEVGELLARETVLPSSRPATATASGPPFRPRKKVGQDFGRVLGGTGEPDGQHRRDRSVGGSHRHGHHRRDRGAIRCSTGQARTRRPVVSGRCCSCRPHRPELKVERPIADHPPCAAPRSAELRDIADPFRPDHVAAAHDLGSSLLDARRGGSGEAR